VNLYKFVGFLNAYLQGMGELVVLHLGTNSIIVMSRKDEKSAVMLRKPVA